MAASIALPEALLARFRAVAFERLERIDTTWAALVRGEATPGSDDEIFRELHTLKGDARVVGFADVAILCQRLEDLLGAARQRRYRVHEDVDIVVTMAIQFAGMLLRKKGQVARGGIDLDGFLKQIEQVLAEWLRQSSQAPQLAVRDRPHLRLDPTQRMSAAERGRLSQAATTVYLEHLRATGRSGDRLRGVWDVLSREIAELETSPLAPLLVRHANAAPDLARELGKSAEVIIEGDVSASHELLATLDTAVLHAVRNAIDHGLEPTDQRLLAGKPPVGLVRVQIKQRDDLVDVAIVDDGRGIDFEGIKRKAERLGLRSVADLMKANEPELAELLFTAGFTTRDQVTDVSGRGVGLDAVRAAAQKLGGNAKIESKTGAGTTVRVTAPNRHASLDVVVFRSPFSPISFAIGAQWTPAVDVQPGEAKDLLTLLELPRATEGEVGQTVVLSHGHLRCHVLVAGTLRRASALRLCPTPDDAPVEVVRLADEEALCIRPERVPGMTAPEAGGG